jgi:hypothetical protein
MKLWKYQHQWAKEGLCVSGSVRLLSSSRSYYLAVSNLFYIFLHLTPFSSGNMPVVYIISSKYSKFSQLTNFVISSMCFVQDSQHHGISFTKVKYKNLRICRCPCARYESIRWGRVVGFMPWPSYILGKISWFLLIRRLVGPQSWSRNFGGDKYLAPYPKSNKDLMVHPSLA